MNVGETLAVGIAATPVGRTVTATGVVTAIDDRLASFTVTAHDGVRTIGEGTHVRGVIQAAKISRTTERQA